ncbi:MAG: TonB-dependent receptor, partial [Bdellovibrionales bacterium]|nr:TonB-dependent receptor [Bdellovibrionales bacterium]
MGSYKQLIWFSITTFITFSPYLVFADSHGKSPYEGLSEACYEVLHDSEGKSSEEERVRCYKEFKQLRDITVVVSASRHEEDLKEVSSPTSVLTQQELVRISADNVAEYLRDIPGVEISDAGQAGQKRIRLRGEEASRVLILIDGQEFTDQREVGTPILIAPEMIERIEVVRGPSSVLYGSKAIGGVINIITKKGGYHPFQATVSHLYDSSTTGHQSFGSLYGSVDWFDYRLSVGKAHHGLRDTPVGEIENTGFEWDTLSAYVGGKFDNHSVGVSYDNYQSASDVFVEDEVRTTPPFLDFQLDIPQRDREKFAFVYDGKNFSESLVKLH